MKRVLREKTDDKLPHSEKRICAIWYPMVRKRFQRVSKGLVDFLLSYR